MFSPGRKPFATKIQEKAKQFRMSPKRLREWYKSQGLSEKDIDEAFSKSNLQRIYSSPFEKLLPRAAALIGWEPQKLRNKIKVEIVNSLDVDCKTIQSTWLTRRIKLRIFAGLSFFINKLSRTFVSEILKKEGEPELPNAIREAKVLLDAFHGKYPKQEAWSITSLKWSPRQELMGAVLLGTLHEAVIAHEFGHILHFIGGSDILEIRNLEEAIREILGNSGGSSSQWTRELVADLIGARLLNQPQFKGEFTARHSLIIFILIIDMIEHKGIVKPTHPPAKIRQGILQTALPELEGNAMIENCKEVCDLIVNLR